MVKKFSLFKVTNKIGKINPILNGHIVETRMVGSELTIFSNIIGAFTISVWRIITQAYGDLLGSPHYPPQVAAL